MQVSRIVELTLMLDESDELSLCSCVNVSTMRGNCALELFRNMNEGACMWIHRQHTHSFTDTRVHCAGLL